ncbi:MAG: hypothetical protein NVS9B10_25610 [Nevskia sp.]
MYFNEPRSEKHPFRFAFALAAALFVNGAIGAAMLHSGIDDRLARDAAAAGRATVVADLGTLPVVNVRACRRAA